MLTGSSVGERAGKRVQTRHALFLWNPETKRVEFTDLIDQGGLGQGWIEARNAGLYMETRIVGNEGHLHWRAWVSREADGAESFRIEAEQKGAWAPGSSGASPESGRRLSAVDQALVLAAGCGRGWGAAPGQGAEDFPGGPLCAANARTLALTSIDSRLPPVSTISVTGTVRPSAMGSFRSISITW